MSDSVNVAVLPQCDICKYESNRNVPAVYDAKTTNGPWANLCEVHFQSHTYRQLGTGYGQRLVLCPTHGAGE